MNPFLRLSAGVFAAMASPQGTTMAERIIAGVSPKIKDNQNMFAHTTWTSVVGNIPGQSISNNASSSINLSQPPTPRELADKCISLNFRKQSKVDLTNGIKSLIDTLPTLQSLNCLSISFSHSDDLLISVATLAVNTVNQTSSVQWDLKETIVDYSNPRVANDIDRLFGSFQPLLDKPYSVSVIPSPP